MSGVIDWLFCRSATCDRLRNDLTLHQGALMDSHDRLEAALATARKARAEADELKAERMLLTLRVVAGSDWRRAYEREAVARREAQMEILRLRERLEANLPVSHAGE